MPQAATAAGPTEAPAALSPLPAEAVAAGYEDRFMVEALAEAKAALDEGEVPVGCVFVLGDDIVARGHNLTNAGLNALEHAELVALSKFDAEVRTGARPPPTASSAADAPPCAETGTIPLDAVTLYVSVEPCLMCGAALLYRRIGRVFYGCANPHFGGNGSILPLNSDGAMGGATYPSIGGCRRDDAVALLQAFYKQENPSAPEDKRARKENR